MKTPYALVEKEGRGSPRQPHFGRSKEGTTNVFTEDSWESQPVTTAAAFITPLLHWKPFDSWDSDVVSQQLCREEGGPSRVRNSHQKEPPCLGGSLIHLSDSPPYS